MGLGLLELTFEQCLVFELNRNVIAFQPEVSVRTGSSVFSVLAKFAKKSRDSVVAIGLEGSDPDACNGNIELDAVFR